MCLVAGAALKPRPDEILFAVSLPLLVIVPYAAASILLALTKLWLVWLYNRIGIFIVHRANSAPQRLMLRGLLFSNVRIYSRSRR
jgi:hypothetical protein